MTPVTGTKTVDIQRKISVTGYLSTRDTSEGSCRGIVQRKNSPHYLTLFGLFFPSLRKLTGIIHKKFTVYSNRLPAFFYFPDNRTKWRSFCRSSFHFTLPRTGTFAQPLPSCAPAFPLPKSPLRRRLFGGTIRRISCFVTKLVTEFFTAEW